ncbi:MAG TPA: hypothetical protein VFL76_03405 [Edaphocola sp.]|nr:hypothetical protein [Edaphocola sp.]
MNKRELKIKLDELGIRPSDYSLDGVLKPMSTILLFSDSRWWTFDYDERGRAQDKMSFDTEDEACQHILSRLIRLQEFREKYNLIRKKHNLGPI